MNGGNFKKKKEIFEGNQTGLLHTHDKTHRGMMVNGLGGDNKNKQPQDQKQGSPYAVKFEVRSHEETERQQRCAPKQGLESC